LKWPSFNDTQLKPRGFLGSDQVGQQGFFQRNRRAVTRIGYVSGLKNLHLKGNLPNIAKQVVEITRADRETKDLYKTINQGLKSKRTFARLSKSRQTV